MSTNIKSSCWNNKNHKNKRRNQVQVVTMNKLGIDSGLIKSSIKLQSKQLRNNRLKRYRLLPNVKMTNKLKEVLVLLEALLHSSNLQIKSQKLRKLRIANSNVSIINPSSYSNRQAKKTVTYYQIKQSASRDSWSNHRLRSTQVHSQKTRLCQSMSYFTSRCRAKKSMRLRKKRRHSIRNA